MGFFTVLGARRDHPITVHKLDVNLWLLPGLFGRTVTFCDVGIKLSVSRHVEADNLGLTIGLPFKTDGRSPADLASVLTSDRTANLVFGNGANAPVPGEDGLYTYDDEDGDNSPITLLPHDEARSTLKSVEADDWPYTTYQMVPRAALNPNRTYYLRLRLRVTDLGQVWRWQRTAGRKAFAIADLRVNEFRDVPTLSQHPDWAGAIDLGRVNFFLVLSAKLKEQRRSPDPKYLRPLETRSWEPYLNRRLSNRRHEPFLIYYWRKTDVSHLHPFRAFLEVERRRPTAAVYAWISSLAIIVALILLWPSFDIAKTLLGRIVQVGWGALAAAGATVAIGALARLAQVLVTNWSRLAGWVERREARRFRIRN